MPRAIWTGTISFGLVSVPVRLFSAISEKKVSFHQFQEGTGERIRYKRVAEESGEEVDYEDIVKGYEIDKGRYVMVTQEELESVEPGRSRTIEIRDFVEIDEVDPIYFSRTYHLAPQEGVGAERPYALLLRAMEQQNKAGIGMFVMRDRQYLAAIRPLDGALALETMHFHDEVRSTDDLPLPRDTKVTGRELDMATQLIESLTTPWKPDQYEDLYRQRVLDLIERKAEGEEIVAEREPEPEAVPDLMEALKRSVEEQRGRRGGTRGAADGRLRQMTKDELYEKAQDLDIPGRSSMDKDELADAIEQAEGKRAAS